MRYFQEQANIFFSHIPSQEHLERLRSCIERLARRQLSPLQWSPSLPVHLGRNGLHD